VLDYIAGADRKVRSSSSAASAPTGRASTSSGATGVHNRTTARGIFGPVAALIEVDGLEDVLRVANDTIWAGCASVDEGLAQGP
jgi:acyl-CoA reductase-like NAD-dependent aldehyde dehydrogenase